MQKLWAVGLLILKKLIVAYTTVTVCFLDQVFHCVRDLGETADQLQAVS